MPRNIIVIGQCRMDLAFDNTGNPAGATAGGELLKAARMLARQGYPVHFVGEACADAVGDSLTAALTESGVDIRSVDRYTEGTTPAILSFPDGRDVCYGQYPKAPMSVVWPRIERGDIVVFGGDYTLDSRVHPQVMELLRYATDLKAFIIYVPLYPQRMAHLVTHAMPAVLDSFETSTLSIVDTGTIKALYKCDDIADAYRAHLSYYDAPALYCADGRLGLYRPASSQAIGASMPGIAALTAATVHAIDTLGMSRDEITTLTDSRQSELLQTISSSL